MAECKHDYLIKTVFNDGRIEYHCKICHKTFSKNEVVDILHKQSLMILEQQDARTADCGVLLTPEEHKEAHRDNISAPSYYTRGKIQTWDFIIDKHLDFLEGNIVKYVVRWKEKNGIEDLKKARVYLDKLIKEAEKK